MKQKFSDKLKIAINNRFKINDTESKINYDAFTKCPFGRPYQVGGFDCQFCDCFTLRKNNQESNGYVICVGQSIIDF